MNAESPLENGEELLGHIATNTLNADIGCSGFVPNSFVGKNEFGALLGAGLDEAVKGFSVKCI